MEELLGFEKDNQGNDVSVYFCQHEGMSAELTAFFARQWAELLDSGFATSNYLPSITNCRCIYVKCDNKIVGLRIWNWANPITTNIILTAVDKDYRRRGLFSIIIDYYDRRFNDKQIISKTFIHVDNTVMLEAAKKNGYSAEFLKMVKKYNL